MINARISSENLVRLEKATQGVPIEDWVSFYHNVALDLVCEVSPRKVEKAIKYALDRLATRKQVGS